MNNSKKRIYITENEDGFKFSEKKRIVSFNRVAFLFFFILFIFLLYSTKIVYLGSSSPIQKYQITNKIKNTKNDDIRQQNRAGKSSRGRQSSGKGNEQSRADTKHAGTSRSLKPL